MGWELGEYWAVDAPAGVLRRRAAWQADDAQLDEFISTDEDLLLSRGEGLPGEAWASAQPTWSQRADQALAGPRSRAAHAHGLSAAVALPVITGADVSGVMVFLGRRHEQPDDHLLALLATMGTRVGNAHQAMHETRQRLRDAFDDAPVASAIAEPSVDGRLLEVNRAFCELLGFSAEELVGRRVSDIIHPADRVLLASVRRELIDSDTPRTSYEPRLVRRDGTTVWTQANLTLVRDLAGRPLYVVSHLQDHTEQKRVEAQLAHLELHDHITGLPNRTLLLDRLSSVRRRRGTPAVALFSLALDRFRLVNEMLGQQGGDEVLRTMGARLAEALRPEDTVSRLDGNHFAVVCECVEPMPLERLVARLRSAVSAPLAVDHHELRLTASVGSVVAGSEDAAVSGDELLRRAEMAMHDAKSRGGDRFEVFEMPVGLTGGARLELEGELRRALARGGIVAHYQPKFELVTGRIADFEALARWNHGERGLVSPAEFIPVAEETGLIIELGVQILAMACRTARELMSCTDLGPPREFCVNLSPRQFIQRDLLSLVRRTLSETGIEPQLLCLEITESTVMAHDDPAPILRALKHLGVKVALDDFGVGSSSLERLRGFPHVDFIKIDRSFIAPLEEDRRSRAIVSAIVKLSHRTGRQGDRRRRGDRRATGHTAQHRLRSGAGIPARTTSAAGAPRRPARHCGRMSRLQVSDAASHSHLRPARGVRALTLRVEPLG